MADRTYCFIRIAGHLKDSVATSMLVDMISNAFDLPDAEVAEHLLDFHPTRHCHHPEFDNEYMIPDLDFFDDVAAAHGLTGCWGYSRRIDYDGVDTTYVDGKLTSRTVGEAGAVEPAQLRKFAAAGWTAQQVLEFAEASGKLPDHFTLSDEAAACLRAIMTDRA